MLNLFVTEGLVLDYAFRTKAYHKVFLRVLDFNSRAIRCYEKCGFVIEGYDRQGAFINGDYLTDVYLGVLKDEYEKK